VCPKNLFVTATLFLVMTGIKICIFALQLSFGGIRAKGQLYFYGLIFTG
jgi:hypothetical protein